MIRDQFSLCMDNEIIVDLFAGGGGMSSAIEMALGRHSDVSVNHNDDAVSMHTVNHPQTRHYRAADVMVWAGCGQRPGWVQEWLTKGGTLQQLAARLDQQGSEV